MSWSVSFIGSPKKITEALDRHGDHLHGASKEEYDEALPHIKALVNQNYNSDDNIALKVDANGHAYNGYSSCSVSVSNLGSILV